MMRSSSITQNLLGGFVAASTVFVACGGDPLPNNEDICRPAIFSDSDSAGSIAPERDPEFEEFLKNNAQQTPDGGWLVEDDIYFSNLNQVYAAFLGVRHEEPQQASQPGADEVTARSAVLCGADDFDVTWDAAEKLRITYCLGQFSDEELRTYVHRGLRLALLQMERTTNINYILIPTDTPEECEQLRDLNQVFYVVRQGVICDDPDPTGETAETCDCDSAQQDCSKKYGRANFPDSSAEVNQSFDGIAIFYPHMKFKPNNEGGPESTVVHEFGHTAALYHEQARFEQGGLDANNSCAPETGRFWRALTPPDSASVMGYRHCDGIANTTSFSYSRRDRQGLSYLYTIPSRGATRLDAGATDDIFWVRPDTNTAGAWLGGTNATGDIVFTPETITLTDAVSRHVKPIPMHISDTDRTDILLYNPGSSADLVVKRSGGTYSTTVLANGGQSERNAIPLAGRFLGGAAVDDVLWWLPGEDGARHDDMWKFSNDATFTASSAYDGSASADSYAWPLLGLWRPDLGSGLPDSQVLWYREQPLSMRLMAQDGVTLNGFVGDTSNETPLCGLESGREYRPLVGNFDFDTADEILWVSPDTDSQVLWWDLASMWGNGGGCTTTNSGSFTFENAAETKPFVGDFDGNGIDDIFWYSGGPLPANLDDPLSVGPAETVWFMGDHVILNVTSFPQTGDYSPYVGDFDGNGCEDILWFAPHQTTSPLWRAKCDPTTAADFVVQAEVMHPQAAYPAGYHPTRGRR